MIGILQGSILSLVYTAQIIWNLQALDLLKVVSGVVFSLQTVESVNILSWLTGQAIISPDTLEKRRHYGMTGSKQTAILVYVLV